MAVFNRWVTLISGIYMMMVSGTIYLFPDYSNVLKTTLNYDVEQINFVGTMLNTGTWASVIGGLFFDRFGPRATSIIGSVILFAGYFFMYLTANKTIGGTYGTLAFFAFLAGQGSGWLHTSAINTNAFNFTMEDRGKILGVLTCGFALCSGIFTLIYKSFFSDSVASFLLFLSLILPFVGIAIGSVFCNFLIGYAKNYQAERNRIKFAYGIMVVIVVLISVAGLVTNFTSVKNVYFCITVIVIIISLSALMFGSEEGFTMSPTATLNLNESNPLIPDKTVDNFDMADKAKVGRRWGTVSNSEVTVELNLLHVIRTLDFWLIFFCFFAVIGAGVTILNNLSEIVTSLEHLEPHTKISESNLPYGKYTVTFVILFSVFNTSGLLTVGMLSDYFLYRFSRASWLIIISSVMALAQVYYLFTTIPFMFGGVLLQGMAYGGTFAIVPTLTSELFGLKHFGANYGFIGLAPALGSELISALLAGSLNDKFKADHYITITTAENIEGVKNCLGRVCYRYTLFVTLGLCCLSILSAFILSLRQKKKASLAAMSTFSKL